MILLAITLLAASAADPTTAAAPATPTPATAPAPPKDDMDRVICHVDPETGTRLGRTRSATPNASGFKFKMKPPTTSIGPPPRGATKLVAGGRPKLRVRLGDGARQ